MAGDAEVTLIWAASSGATSYSLYRGTTPDGEGQTPIAIGIVGTFYSDTGLTNGTTYYYKVAAVDANGTSALSAQASATPEIRHRGRRPYVSPDAPPSPPTR